MGRRHIHFALGIPSSSSSSSKTKVDNSDDLAELDLSAEGRGKGDGKVMQEVEGEQVVSGMRSSADVLVWVDVKRSAREGGIKWWRSENGVVLTEGDGKGEVKLEWVRWVERRGTGEVIWRNEGMGEEAGK